MSRFNDIVLKWREKEYRIEGDNGGIMKMLAKMQDEVTVAKAFSDSDSGEINMARYANAYAVALNAAGCKVDSMDVYSEMLGEGSADIAPLVVFGVIQIYISVFPEEKEAKKKPSQQSKTKKASSKTK